MAILSFSSKSNTITENSDSNIFLVKNQHTEVQSEFYNLSGQILLRYYQGMVSLETAQKVAQLARAHLYQQRPMLLNCFANELSEVFKLSNQAINLDELNTSLESLLNGLGKMAETQNYDNANWCGSTLVELSRAYLKISRK